MSRVLAVIALATLAVTAAGCGGSTSAAPGVAQLGTTAATTTTSSQGGSPTSGSGIEGMRRYAACMRSNGVPGFPDPKSSGNGMSLTIGAPQGITPDSPQFKAAEKSCQKLLPNGGNADPAMQAKAQAEMLKFSACMRSHGLPNFPDPTFSGGRIRMSVGKGLNPSSPVFQAAQKACESLMPGPKGGAKAGMSQGPGAGKTSAP